MILVNKRGRSTTTTTNRMSGSGRRQNTTGQTITQRHSLTNPHQPMRPTIANTTVNNPTGANASATNGNMTKRVI